MYNASPGSVKRYLLRIFTHIGPPARGLALGSVLDTLIDPDDELRTLAQEALRAFGPAQIADKPLLLKKSQHPDIRIRKPSVLLLLPLCDANDVNTVLLPLLKDPDLELRRIAVGISISNPEIRKQLERHLLPRINDPDPEIRLAIAEAIREFQTINNEELCLRLEEHYQQEEEKTIHKEIAVSLAILTKQELNNIPRLRKLVLCPYDQATAIAAERLKVLGNAAVAAVPDLVARLNNSLDQ